MSKDIFSWIMSVSEVGKMLLAGVALYVCWRGVKVLEKIIAMANDFFKEEE